jgi:hypothetical protein
MTACLGDNVDIHERQSERRVWGWNEEYKWERMRNVGLCATLHPWNAQVQIVCVRKLFRLSLTHSLPHPNHPHTHGFKFIFHQIF